MTTGFISMEVTGNLAVVGMKGDSSGSRENGLLPMETEKSAHRLTGNGIILF